MVRLIDEDAAGYPWIQWRQRRDLEEALGRCGSLWEQERVLELWTKVLGTESG